MGKKHPNQQRTLNKLPTELRCRNFANKHRLSVQIGTKRAKTCVQHVYIPTELPFCMPPLLVGMASTSKSMKEMKRERERVEWQTW